MRLGEGLRIRMFAGVGFFLVFGNPMCLGLVGARGGGLWGSVCRRFIGVKGARESAEGMVGRRSSWGAGTRRG